MKGSKHKKQLLFVLENLRKAGAQKFMFELIKLLDKSKFDIHILCGIASKNKLSVLKQEYYWLYQRMGLTLHPIIGEKEAGKILIPLPKLKQYFKAHPILRKIFTKINRSINPLFYKKIYVKKRQQIIDSSDRIIAIDFYSYDLVRGYLTKEEKANKLDIFLLCHARQFPNMYNSFEKDISFNFFYFDEKQKEEAISQNLENSTYLYQPLLLSLEKKVALSNVVSFQSNIFNIGIFTRLSGYDKLIDVFIIAFHGLLVETKRNIYLNIIGENILDPQYINHLNYLIRFHGIEERVKFHGHQTNLKAFLNKNSIDLAWQHSIGSTFGYVSLELIEQNVPVCGFSFYSEGADDEDKTISYSVVDLISCTKLYLLNSTKREEYLQYQLQTLVSKHDSLQYSKFWNQYFDDKKSI